MKGRPGDKVRLQHILDAIHEIELYLDGVSYDQFLANSEKRFATIKQIEIIGEACNELETPLIKKLEQLIISALQGCYKKVFCGSADSQIFTKNMIF